MTRPLVGYIGGKWYLRHVICPIIDAAPHHCYVEPFAGMGNVFLGRQRRPRIEVINDRSNDVATLFRVVQRHPDELARMLRFQIASRDEYTRLYRTDATTLTDIERAVRFLVLRRLTFAGKDPYPAGFATSRTSSKALDASEIIRRLEDLHERLNRVVIECLDFEECLKRYDGAGSFFYLDPPYWGCTHLYRDGGFKPADFERLAKALRRLRGRWLLSLNDHPAVRQLFRWAKFRRVSTRYNAAVKSAPRTVSELLIGPRLGS